MEFQTGNDLVSILPGHSRRYAGASHLLNLIAEKPSILIAAALEPCRYRRGSMPAIVCGR